MPIKRNPDATSGAKLLKLFRRLLLNGRKHYLQELAQWLDCSPQTVMRLVAEIEREIGTSLETGQDQRRRWYRILPQTGQPFGMHCEEIRYIALCKELAAPYLPKQILKRIDTSISHLFLTLMEPSSAGDKENVYAFFSKGHIDYTPHFKHLELLEQAIAEKQICRILYRASGRQEAREHCVLPLRLVSMNNALYLIGAAPTEDMTNIRYHTNMAIHRIQKLELTQARYTAALPEEDADNLFGLPWHEPRTFHIHFNPGKPSDYVRERVWSNSQVMHPLADGSLLLQITTRSEPELLAWVRSFGPEARLLTQVEAQALLSLQDKGQ